MVEKTKLILALMVCLALPSASLYAISRLNAPEDEPDLLDGGSLEDVALEFLKEGATFSFDGILESINVVNTYTMESYPLQHVFVIEFNTSHAGWGNREGTFIAPVITHHTIKITVVEESVVSAVIDDIWDELNEEQIVPEELLMPERARDKAIDAILVNYTELEDLEIPSSWIVEVRTPEGLLGCSTMRYISNGWNVTVKYAVVQYPDFNIDIEYTGTVSFHWSGVVYSNGDVSTDEFVLN